MAAADHLDWRESLMRPARGGLVLTVSLTAALLSACASRQITPGIFLDRPRPGDTSPVATRAITPDGLALTKLSEGFRARLYDDSANFCSIAYGHLVRPPHACDGSEPENFRIGLSLSDGEALLIDDMQLARRAVTLDLSDLAAYLTDDQYSALCDFVYNVGGDHFRGSTLRNVLDAHNYGQVPQEMRRWVLAGGKKSDGLLTRREREIQLFFKGGSIPKPRPGDARLSPIDITVGEQ